MANVSYKDLLDAGVHFGHLTRKWNPHIASYIFIMAPSKYKNVK